MSAYKSLLSPISIGGLTIKNRVLSTAHAPGYAENGMPGERYRAYHDEKARGGIGLTTFSGSSNISRDSGSIYGQIYVGSDDIVPVFRRFATGKPCPFLFEVLDSARQRGRRFFRSNRTCR